MKRILRTMLLSLSILLLMTACRDAEVVSHNISKESDQFRVRRRIVFYNSITDTYMLEMIGNCSIDIDRENTIAVTCKTGEDDYQKHYMGLSDNVTYTVEQLESSNVNKYKYELVFKPKSILPITIDVE